MILIFLISNLLILILNQTMVINNQLEELSLYKIKNEDIELTVWIRFQSQFIKPQNQLQHAPFAKIIPHSGQYQLIMNYQIGNHTGIQINIPQQEYKETLLKVNNSDSQSWFCFYLQKDSKQFKQIQINNVTLSLPEYDSIIHNYFGYFITWQNLTFSLKAYIGRQQYNLYNTFYLSNNDNIFGLSQRTIMEYKNQIEIQIYLRKRNEQQSIILWFNHIEYDYKLFFRDQVLIAQIKNLYYFETMNFENIQLNQWFQYKMFFQGIQTLTQINTQERQQEWVYLNKNLLNIQGQDLAEFGLNMYFNSKQTEISNLLIINRINQQEFLNICYHGCKNCTQMKCIECETNLNLSNQCSCKENQFYDKQLQICQEITHLLGLSLNPEEVIVCSMYEYFNTQQQKCLKCPKVEEYYCTDCVYNTESWKKRKLCTFQDINSQIVLQYISLNFNPIRISDFIEFDENYSKVLNQQECLFIQDLGQIICKQNSWQILKSQICDVGQYNFILQQCNIQKGYFNQFQQSIMCWLNYTQVKKNCIRCPSHCVICQYKLKQMKCLITKQGFQIKQNYLARPNEQNEQWQNTELNYETDIKNCQLEYKQKCCFCIQNYILDENFNCILGQDVSKQYNFEFFSTKFESLSKQQLIQLLNQDIDLNKSSFDQLIFFGKQYENIKLNQISNSSNTYSLCNQYIYFNNSKKCQQFRDNYLQIKNYESVNYCSNKRCSYNLTVNIKIYVSNIQILIYENKTYINIQQFLDNLLIKLHLMQITFIAEVYVFDSHEQEFRDGQMLWLDDKLINLFYPETIFKLILQFQGVAQFPACQAENFYSNFHHIDIKDLQTYDQLLIQFKSKVIEFYNCRFFNSQEIILCASHILFFNISFVDSLVKTTFIEMSYNQDIDIIQFINCNFINIVIDDQNIFIYIMTQVNKFIIRDLNIYQVYLFNSSFMQFQSFNQLLIQRMIIGELDSVLSVIFSYSNVLFKDGFTQFDNVSIINSSFQQTIFYQIDFQAELMNFEISNTNFYDSQLFYINHRIVVDNILLRELILEKSSVFYCRYKSQNMTIKNIKIIDTHINQTQYLIYIEAYEINIEQIIIANCSYTPPMNIFDIKARLGGIHYIKFYNVTYYIEQINFIPIFMLNFDIVYINVTQIYFQIIKINQAKLLYTFSQITDVFGLQLSDIVLSGGSLNEIIRFQLYDRQSKFTLAQLSISNILIKWLSQSQIIYIQGNNGQQQIKQVYVNKIVSQFDHHVFYCSKNNLWMIDIEAQFNSYAGLVNQYQSRIVITNFLQTADQNLIKLGWPTPIFTNTDHTSQFESISIYDSSFISIRQPIISFKHYQSALIHVKNIQVLQYEGIADIFQLYYLEGVQSDKVRLVISVEKLQIQNTKYNDSKRFIYCERTHVILNQIYFFQTQQIILQQIKGSSLFMRNIYVQNSHLQRFSYFILNYTESYIFAENIYVINQTGNCAILEILVQENFQQYHMYVSLQNIFVDQCKDCANLVKLDFQRIPQIFHFKNIFITQSHFIFELFNIVVANNFLMVINNLYIQNTNLKQLGNIWQKKVKWGFNQLFLDNAIFSRNIISDNFQFHDCYILNSSFNGSGLTIKNENLILAQNQRIFQQPLALSFNKKSFYNSSQIETNIYQVHFKVNHTVAYIPTGIQLSEFIYMNPITQQQERPYDDFIIFVNQLAKNKIICFLNQAIDGIEGNFSNMNQFVFQNGINIIENLTFFMNPYSNYTEIQNDIICNENVLRFNIRTLPCQLGEYLYQNKCHICDTSKNYYSVSYRASICTIIDNSKIEQIKIGKVKLIPGFWRAKQHSNMIEQCKNEQCLGGWIPGDNSCAQGYVGAVCSECDINNVRGFGKFALAEHICQPCIFNYQIILKGVFISLWLMFLGYMSYTTNQHITQQYLFFKLVKRQFADILMRQSINQISILIKIFTNYIFYLYVIKDQLDFANYQLQTSLKFVSNPNLLTTPQLDCFFVEFHNLGVHYLQLVFSVISPFVTLSLLYLTYQILLKFKLIQFQFSFIIITIYSVYLFNQQLIFQNQIQLTSYNTLSNIQWINLNKQFEFNTPQHHHIMYFYIIPSIILLSLIPTFIYLTLRKSNKKSIRTTKYFGILYTEYKQDQYYWEILRIYQKQLVIAFTFYFDVKFLFYLIQCQFALQVFFQPYALKNLNYTEQKTLQILLSSIVTVLFFSDHSKLIRVILFSILNILLIYDFISSLVSKILQKYKALITRIQIKLIYKLPMFQGCFDIERAIKVQYNINMLRTLYDRKMIKSIRISNQSREMEIQENDQRLESEIEMTFIRR